MAEVVCPNCRARLLSPLGHTGPSYRCPFCGTTVQVSPAATADNVSIPSPEPQQPAAVDPGHAVSVAVPPPGRGVPTRLIVYVLLSVAALCVVFAVLVLLAGNVKRAADRALAMNHMKQIGLACNSYQDAYKFLPTPKVVSPEGDPVDLSWRVTILPYIEEFPLFKRFSQTSGWDSPDNKEFLEMMPAIYADPLRQQEPEGPKDFQKTHLQTTHFQMFTGPGTAFPDNDKVARGRGLHDNDFLVGEAARDVPWTKPADMVVQPDQPLPLASGTVLIALADGSVREVDRDRISDEALRWYLRPNEGTPPPLD